MAALGVSDPWVLFGLLSFSLVVTLGANWLVGGLRRPTLHRDGLLGAIVASSIWILVLFVASAVALRYMERMARPVVGYLAFCFVAILMSLAQALLHRRVQEQKLTATERQRWDVNQLIHTAVYLLFPVVLYLGFAWLSRQPANPILFIPLCIGALLPDLDSQNSVAGRMLPFLSRPLEKRLGHRQEWHTLAGAAFVALITSPLIAVIGVAAWSVVPLGFISHLALDTLGRSGLMLFWPLSRTRYSILGGPVETPGDTSERRLGTILAILAVVLLLTVDVGPPPAPPVVVASYEQTVENYYGLRGRSLVFADVEGTWQASGRRITGRFEILNASGPSFVLLDRFTGRVFTGGRAAADNLCLNRITLQIGSAARIKPVELHLEEQRLAEALPVLYEMQREPGLQHIFVSGDVILPTDTTLEADYDQEQLRKIQTQGDTHFSLHYLSASELIELADVRVKNGDLVIVATYVSPATGPTPTPLPPPPATAEESP